MTIKELRKILDRIESQGYVEESDEVYLLLGGRLVELSGVNVPATISKIQRPIYKTEPINITFVRK
jgi:hypothetical protein